MDLKQVDSILKNVIFTAIFTCILLDIDLTS
jgi:hypothetical protein